MSILAAFIDICKNGVNQNNPVLVDLANTFHLLPQQFIPKTNVEGYHYFLYELDNTVETIISTENNEERFILKSHHLSFPRKISKEIPCLNTHYTAIFEKNGQEYELHVFYLSNDNLALPQQIQLTNISAQSNHKKTAEKSVDAYLVSAFVELANQHYDALVKNLRSAIEFYTKNLAEDVNQSIIALENMCFQNDESSRAQYVECIKPLLPKLTDLDMLHPDPQYAGLLKLFTRQSKVHKEHGMLAAASNSHSQLEKISTKSSNEKELNTANINQKKKKNKTKKKNKSPTPAEQLTVQLPTLVQQAEEAYHDFQALCSEAKLDISIENVSDAKTNQLHQQLTAHQINSQSMKKILEAFLTFSHKIIDADLLITDYTQVSIDILNKIDSLTRIKLNQGIQLLENCLKANEFALANQLTQYLPCIHQKIARYAMTSGNASLLDYMLNHSEFEINTFTVADGLSPIAYCYTHYDSSTDMIDVFKILIKYGALLTESIEPNGLCIANLILQNTEHALRPTLPKKILSQKFFIQFLYADIKKYLDVNENKLDVKTNARLYAMMIDYEARKNSPLIMRTTHENLATHYFLLTQAICTNTTLLNHFVKYYLQVNRSDINKECPSSGMTPLIGAIKYQNMTGLLNLLNEYKKINAENKMNLVQGLPLIENINLELLCSDGLTALIHTIKFNQYFMMKILLQAGANPDQPCKNGRSPLVHCIAVQNVSMLELLISMGAKVNHCISKMDMPILFYAVNQGNLSIINVLLKAGADPNHQEKKATLNSPLHSAVLANHENKLDIIKALVEHNANILLENNKKHTPLYLAIEKGLLEVIEYFIFKLAGQDANSIYQLITENEMLHLSANYNQTKLINYFLNFCDINLTDEKGATALIVAAKEKNYEALELLLEKNANPNFSALDSKMTALHFAAINGDLKQVKILIANGAGINQVDKNNATPLHWAAQCYQYEIVKFLLEQNADYNIRMLATINNKEMQEVTAEEYIGEYASTNHAAKKIQLLLARYRKKSNKQAQEEKNLLSNKSTFFQAEQTTTELNDSQQQTLNTLAK